MVPFCIPHLGAADFEGLVSYGALDVPDLDSGVGAHAGWGV